MTATAGEAILDELLERDTATFWTERATLTHIRQFARARLCSPWAVLGVVLARVTTAIDPGTVLPPLVGSEASLNLFVALTGPSGMGKGAAERAAADAVDVGHIDVATVGSGEGIAHLYAHRENGNVIRDRYKVLFTVPEVDNLVALGNRQGATLLPQLRMAWSGEKLGFSYADPKKALPIERHTYRLGLVLGVQPGRAGPLIDDVDGGTPQRFVWLPTVDPDAPDEPPRCPTPIGWHNPTSLKLAQGLSVLTVPDVARDTILDARRTQLRGDGVALDGHALLARLKVAAALAFLDGHRDVHADDWRLAGTVMGVSERTRDLVVAHLLTKATETNRVRGEAEGSRAVIIGERVAEAQVQRVARTILRALRKREDWSTRRDVATTVAGNDRGALDPALAALVDAGQVEVETDTGKPLYRLAAGA